MRIDRVDADAWVAIGKEYGSSSLVLSRGSDALLIEALGSRGDAEELQRWIEGTLEKRVRLIIATHYFSDHLAAIERFPDAIVITHSSWREVWKSEAYRSAEEESWLVEPTIEVNDGLRISWGRFALDLFHNPGHTAGTLNVDIPQLDLIHVGDTLVGNVAYVQYSTPQRLLDAIDRIRERNRSRLMSSHGPVRDAVALDHAEHYLRRLVEHVSRLRSGAESREASPAIPARDCYPAGVEPTPFEEIFHQRNLDTMMAEG